MFRWKLLYFGILWYQNMNHHRIVQNRLYLHLRCHSAAAGKEPQKGARRAPFVWVTDLAYQKAIFMSRASAGQLFNLVLGHHQMPVEDGVCVQSGDERRGHKPSGVHVALPVIAADNAALADFKAAL